MSNAKSTTKSTTKHILMTVGPVNPFAALMVCDATPDQTVKAKRPPYLGKRADFDTAADWQRHCADAFAQCESEVSAELTKAMLAVKAGTVTLTVVAAKGFDLTDRDAGIWPEVGAAHIVKSFCEFIPTLGAKVVWL